MVINAEVVVVSCPELDAKFLAALCAVDEAYAERVRKAGCVHCGGVLDDAKYPRKPRGELGEASAAWAWRLSFCCRREGCRRRATPPSLRFFGRRVYLAVLVVVASAAGRAMTLEGRGRAARVHEVPVRTVRRWLGWWETVFVLRAFWLEAKALFAPPVEEGGLPGTLLARFGAGTIVALEKTLRFLSPITTSSVKARIAMGD